MWSNLNTFVMNKFQINERKNENLFQNNNLKISKQNVLLYENRANNAQQ